MSRIVFAVAALEAFMQTRTRIHADVGKRMGLGTK